MNRAVRTVTPVLVLFVASVAAAQPVGPPDPAALRGDSGQTRKRLAEAEQKLLTGKGADAVDDLQRVLDESADDLIALDGREYRAARWVIHALLAKLPPDALRAYQDRIDQPAKRLLERGKLDRDPRPLWQLLDRYFVSRPSDEALLLLGDLLFERGEFRAAANQWRRLLPDAGADLVYPGSKADPALVQARVALAAIFQNDAARAAAEVAAVRAKYPTATGTLAGKTGPLAETLQSFLKAPPKLLPDATTGTAWTTFGGGPDRAGRVPGGIPAAWPSRPTHTEDIPGIDPDHPPRQPFGHPVIVNGEIFVTDGTRLYGFDLRTGESTGRQKIALLDREKIPRSETGSGPPDPQVTLTAAEGLLYARIGAAAVRPPPAGVKPEYSSAIVCLRPKAREIGRLWQLTPPEDAAAAAVWEGTPLVSGRRLWAVYAKFEGGRVIHALACYDPSDAEKAPERPVWVTELCDGAQPLPGSERTRQELLTLAGRHIVFCSNTGAVVAVDAATGRRAWGYRYPRARKTPPGASADPTPAVAFAGRVFVAPADADSVFALDAETGARVWATDSGSVEGAQLLGVSRGRLIVAAAGPYPLRGIRGLDLETGSLRGADGGWFRNSYGVLSDGHGFVTDDVIVWPSRAGLYFLDPRDGRPGEKNGTPNPLPKLGTGCGHVAYADGTLVVVTPTQVCVYRAQAMKTEPLPDAPPRQRFDALVSRAEGELAAGQPARALTVLAEASTGDLPAPFRAWAAARMLQIAPPATDRSQLPPEVRDALRPAILNEWIVPSDGVPVQFEAYLLRRLGRGSEPVSVPAAAPGPPPPAPGLAPDADIDRTWKLPPAVAPLRPVPGANCGRKCLFAAGSRAVVAVPLDRSAPTEYTAADLFTHAADLRTGFVAAGPFAVAVYGADREPLWVFRVPLTERLPDGPPPFRLCCGREPECPQLSSFVLAGAWLLARVGEYHLIALDLTARRVAWVLDSEGGAGYAPNRFPGAARFGPHLVVIGTFAVAQLSDGLRWCVDLRTGRPVAPPPRGDRTPRSFVLLVIDQARLFATPVFGEHTARAWWPGAPVEFGLDRVLVADGPGLVRLVQPGGRTKWTFEVDREEGLTGEPAQVWTRGNLLGGGNPPRVPPTPPLLLVAVRRNHGVEIERVDAATGKSAWSCDPVFVDADRIDFTAADADAERVYVPAANKLMALSVATGKTAWEVELPDARGPRGWIVRAGKTCVIAYPAEAVPAEPPGAVWDRLARSFAREPFVWRLPGLADTLYDTWVARAVPVLLFDPETGKRLARYDIPARGPAVTAHFGADVTAIATGDRVVWLK